MSIDWRAPAHPEAERFTSDGFTPTEKLAEAVLRHLARDIIAGRLRPRQRLIEERLSEELGVSRSPVREAIHRLAAEGLVDLVARRGAFVADLTPDEVSDVFAVRAQLERFSARLAARHASAREVEGLRAHNSACARVLASADLAGFFEHNDAFHRALAALSRNAYLQRVRQAAASRTFRPLFLYLSSAEHVAGSIDEHEGVVAAIEAHDEDLADQLMARHLENSQDHALRLLAQAAERRATA